MKHLHIALSLSLVALVLSGCGELTRKEPTQRETVRVNVLEIEAVNESSETTYIGKILATKSAVINTPFPATLTAIKVTEGDRVKEGDILAEISSESVNSALKIADATLRQAQDGFNRLEKVRGNGSVSEVKVVEVTTALEKASAAFASARKAAEDCTVRAPFAGTISDRFCEEGVSLGLAEPLFKIVDIDQTEISFSVPEAEVHDMRLGDCLQVRIPALDNALFEATLIRKAVDASTLSHNYDCTLKPSIAIKGLMPGMSCKVIKRQTSDEQRIVIPTGVVRTGNTGRYIWLVDKDNRIVKQEIKIGNLSGRGVEVTEGLSVGDRVVVEGISKVSTGMKVEVL